MGNYLGEISTIQVLGKVSDKLNEYLLSVGCSLDTDRSSSTFKNLQYDAEGVKIELEDLANSIELKFPKLEAEFTEFYDDDESSEFESNKSGIVITEKIA